MDGSFPRANKNRFKITLCSHFGIASAFVFELVYDKTKNFTKAVPCCNNRPRRLLINGDSSNRPHNFIHPTESIALLTDPRPSQPLFIF